jgi:hypothetical protein
VRRKKLKDKEDSEDSDNMDNTDDDEEEDDEHEEDDDGDGKCKICGDDDPINILNKGTNLLQKVNYQHYDTYQQSHTLLIPVKLCYCYKESDSHSLTSIREYNNNVN